MPVLRFFCQRAANHYSKQHKYALTKRNDTSQSTTTRGHPREIKTCAGPLREDEDFQRQFSSRRSALNFDTLGSWNNKFDLPVNVEQSIRLGKLVPEILIENVGAVSLVGRRPENEDRYKVVDLQPRLLMFSIFDGHGGSTAADYASQHLEQHIRFWLERGEKDLFKILRTSFIEVNNAFTRHLYRNYIANAPDPYSTTSKRGNEQALNAGTTATVCLLRNSVELVIAHVGDSKALMCRKGKVVRLTHDHKPTDPKEAERIKKSGGVITSKPGSKSRVMGKLDMSRSIGDVELKSIGVTAEPDIRSIEVKHGKDAFMVLMTDGVSYVVSDQEVVDIAATCETAQEAAQILTDQALHFGSEDNATAMIIPFGAWGKYANSSQTVQFSFGRNIISSRYN